MSSKDRKKKKIPQPRPWYTKYKGYQFVECNLRESKQQLLKVAAVLENIRCIDRSGLLVGEIQQLEEVDTVVRGNVPEIIKMYSDLGNTLKEFIAVKRELDDLDFRPQVDAALAFLDKLMNDIVAPVASAEAIIDGAIARTKVEETVNEHQ